jgi:hypothetical protein
MKTVMLIFVAIWVVSWIYVVYEMWTAKMTPEEE